jgi:hypothetical protein
MEDGYATAEAAVALPALMAVLALAVGALVTVHGQLRCVDAARTAARAAARGDSDAATRAAAAPVAPPGAQFDLERHGDEVVVSVRVTLHAGRWLPGVPLHARAVAEVER